MFAVVRTGLNTRVRLAKTMKEAMQIVYQWLGEDLVDCWLDMPSELQNWINSHIITRDEEQGIFLIEDIVYGETIEIVEAE